MTVGAVVAICNLLGGWIVDLFAAHDMSYYGLLTVRAIAAVLCVVEIYLYFHIREYPYESSGDRFTVRELFTRPLHEKKYLYTIAVVFVWNITANVPGSYYTVYLLRNVEMAYSTITLINMLNVPIVLFLTPVWRRVLGKYGWFRTLSFSMSIYALHYFLLAAVTKERPVVYALALMLGFTFAIGTTCSFTRHSLRQPAARESDGVHRLLFHLRQPCGAGGRDRWKVFHSFHAGGQCGAGFVCADQQAADCGADRRSGEPWRRSAFA